jgi:predicted nucleotidyltransferase
VQFRVAVQALCDAGVEFVVIGGLCATLHGSARVTYDLDICHSRKSSNLKKLAAALAPFHPRPRGFPPGLPFLWDDTTLRNGTVFTLQTDIGEIDLLAEVAGLGDFDDLQQYAMKVAAFGREILTLDLPGLILAKKAAGREKDIAALVELEGLLGTGEF